MAISLRKGQKVDLTKTNPNLETVMIGLGWDVNVKGVEFDLDAAAFLLKANGKVKSDEDFIFYNNPTDEADSIKHLGDNLTGEGEGDDEQINIYLDKVPMEVHKIAFTVTIHEAKERNQSFGQISNAFIRLVDKGTNEELIRYDLEKDFSVETAIVVAELYRHNGEWKFSAIGSGFEGGLYALCKNFGVELEDEEDQEVVEEAPVVMSSFDLLKKKVGVVLEKKQLSDFTARVGLVLDISGSMNRLYRNGTVQNVVERILAVASKFDDDGMLDMWMFDHRFTRLPSVGEGDFEDYINREILNKFKRKEIFGRNDEAPVIADVIKKYTKEEKAEIPTFIVFISDGGVKSSRQMEKLIIKASKKPIFWQFVGLGKANYGILRKLDSLSGRYVDNASFFELDDINAITDEELYDRLLNELPMWINEIKNRGMLV